MSTYLTDSAAREHANTLLAEAARSRRVHEARAARRASQQSASRADRRVSRPFRHPFVAAHQWLSAGQM